MRKTWLAPLFAAFTAAAGIAVATPAAAQTTLKMAYALSASSHYGAGGEAFSKSLEAGTGGRFKVQQFPSSALGGEREVIEGLQLGTIDLAILSTGATLNFVPQTGVFDIPFLMRDLAHARQVMDGPVGQDMLKAFSARGLEALAWGEQGFRHLTNSKRAVTTAADAKGLKIRTTENPVHITAFRQIGILPTPMAWPEVATAPIRKSWASTDTPLNSQWSMRRRSVMGRAWKGEPPRMAGAMGRQGLAAARDNPGRRAGRGVRQARPVQPAISACCECPRSASCRSACSSPRRPAPPRPRRTCGRPW